MEASKSLYGYEPTRAANAVGCAAFSAVLVANIILCLRAMDTWMFLLWSTAAGLEIATYTCRIIGSSNSAALGPFLGQGVCSMIAPTFIFLALMNQLAVAREIFGHKLISGSVTGALVFLALFNIPVLVFQALGTKSFLEDEDNTGFIIRLVAVCAQMGTMILFLILLVISGWHVINGRSDWDIRFERLRQRRLFKFWLPAAGISSALLLIRMAYRVAASARRSHVEIEPLFLTLDGFMVFLAMIALIIIHPSIAHGQADALMRATDPEAIHLGTISYVNVDRAFDSRSSSGSETCSHESARLTF